MIPRSFSKCGFSTSKLPTDILVSISRLERKWHLSGLAFVGLLKNHWNIFLVVHSSFFHNLIWKCFVGVWRIAISVTCRSSRPEVFLRKGVLKICSQFTGEHPCRSAIEIALRYGCSPVNLQHIFRAPFSRNTSGWPLLNL